jgi:TrmH family RNA methyltransferase
LPVSSELGRLCVVLVNTRNPLNIGAAARAMSNFGFADLRVVNPYEPAFREAQSAVGAAALLRSAAEYRTVADAVADCSLVVGTTALARRELQHPLQPMEAAARLIRKQLKSGRVALLFGSEKRGLSNEDLSHCHWLLRIPTRPEHGSMNLGQAVAVCLYELSREAGAAKTTGKAKAKSAQLPNEGGTRPARLGARLKPGKTNPATAGEVERITALLLEALYASGFMDRRRPASADERVRRMVRRLHLSVGDAEAWQGMLRQMVWKMSKK